MWQEGTDKRAQRKPHSTLGIEAVSTDTRSILNLCWLICCFGNLDACPCVPCCLARAA